MKSLCTDETVPTGPWCRQLFKESISTESHPFKGRELQWPEMTGWSFSFKDMYENKSCHENYSPLSKIQTITTLGEDELVRDLIISRQSTGEYVVELPEPSKGATELCVYTAQGALIHSQAIPYQTTHVILPILPTSRMYLLKLVEFGKMNRKAASAKLIN